MNILKAYKTTAEIQGLIKEVLVTIECEVETDLYLDHWDEELAKKTRADMAKGLTEAYFVNVRCQFVGLDGFEGVNSLGQTFARPSESLKDLLQTVDDHAMVLGAKVDLIEKVMMGVSNLNTFMGVQSEQNS